MIFKIRLINLKYVSVTTFSILNVQHVILSLNNIFRLHFYILLMVFLIWFLNSNLLKFLSSRYLHNCIRVYCESITDIQEIFVINTNTKVNIILVLMG